MSTVIPKKDTGNIMASTLAKRKGKEMDIIHKLSALSLEVPGGYGTRLYCIIQNICYIPLIKPLFI